MTYTQDFNQLPTTKKGTIAENYVKKYLANKGYNVLWNTNEKSSPFDGMATDYKRKDRWRKMLVEVKCKYPTPDGEMSVHLNDLQLYSELEKEELRPMCIFFVDPLNKNLYQTNIKRIRDNFTKMTKDPYDKVKDLFYFDIKALTQIEEIPTSVINEFNELERLNKKIKENGK